MKERIFFSRFAYFEFTMTSFKGYSRNHINIVNIFFSTWPYARTSGKFQHIGNIVSVDKLKVAGYAFKQLILTNPFNGEENWIVFFRKGNNFEYKSSGRYQFFWSIFWKLPILPNGRIFRFREKNLREYCVRTRNLGCPDRCAKKTNLNCHPKMPSKNSPKTTLLHTWWLEVKKSHC